MGESRNVPVVRRSAGSFAIAAIGVGSKVDAGVVEDSESQLAFAVQLTDGRECRPGTGVKSVGGSVWALL